MATTPLSQAIMQGMDPNVYRPLSDIQQGDALVAAGMDASPTSKWGAIGRLAQTLAGSYLSNSANSELAKTIAGGKKSATDQLLAALSRPTTIPAAPPASAPVRPMPQPNAAAPQPAPPIAPEPGSPNAAVASRFPEEWAPGTAASPLPAGAPSPLDTAAYPAGPAGAPGSTAIADASQPRGIRNNNPLNIEAGDFTQGQPGFSGSDGRFARFETPEHGIAAADKLLDIYEKKHGLNTVAGILSRWAPSADGNNVMAYASDVAGRLGIDPNAPVPKEMRPQLIAAMAQHENGKPAPGTDQAPYKVAGPAVAAPRSSVPSEEAETTATAAPGGVDVHRLMAVMQNPYADDATKAIASKLIMQQMGPAEYGFQTLPDGTIVRTDPRSGDVKPVFQGASKSTFGVIGEEDGKRTYGFIDANKRKVTPLETAKPGDDRPTVTGPDGKEIVIPKGVDVPTFRKEISKINADAAGGKMTETQAKSTSFASRMEAAEAALAKGNLTKEATGASGAAQQVAGGIPVVGSALQSSEYQKYGQAKSQFITALLRQESGAAINKSEFDRYDREFFPQPGDKPEVIQQKADARKVAIESMKKGAGPSYKSPTTPEAAATPTPAPSTAVEKTIGSKTYVKRGDQWFEK